MVWFMGSPVAAVFAAAGALMHAQAADDSALLLLRFADGRFAQVSSIGYRDGAVSYGMDLVCERGTLRIDFARGVWIGRGGAWTALEKEFPRRAGQEVKIIRPRPDGTYYRACPKCEAELDMAAGEWVPEHPGRPIHGYRISQLFSSKVDPGEILDEYRTTRFLDRFYNLKIWIPWAESQGPNQPVRA